jgi:uncharacterized membrane protein
VRLGPARGLLGALAAAQIAYGRAPAPRPPGETRGVVGLALLAAGVEAVEARGRRGALVTATAGALGFGAELIGVATGRLFGDYAYSRQLGPRVGGVPLLAAAAWAMLARPAWVAAGWITPRPLRRVPLAAAALTAWDVFLDPRMVREGYWAWPAGGRYEGVPASNFAGWFGTALVIFATVSVADRAAPGPRDDGALALYTWTWVGEAVANASLWRRPRTALAGTIAMGAIAVPALLGRRR